MFIGFSWGAFIVRCLAALIRGVGIYKNPENHDLDRKLELWRGGREHRNLESAKKERLPHGTTKKSSDAYRDVVVELCAVWDTVASLSLGVTSILAFVHHKPLGIKHAIHALALDKHWGSFPPRVWSRVRSGQTFKQCWFRGRHSHVGGGSKDVLNNILSLVWIVSQLQSFVKFDLDKLKMHLQSHRPTQQYNEDLDWPTQWNDYGLVVKDSTRGKAYSTAFGELLENIDT